MKKDAFVATLVGLGIVVAIVVGVFYSSVERFEEDESDDDEVPPAPETFDPDPSDSDSDSENEMNDENDESEDPSRGRGGRAAGDGPSAEGQPQPTRAGSKYLEGGRELMSMMYEDIDDTRAKVGVVRGKSVAEEEEWWKVMPRPALEQDFEIDSLARDFAPF